MSSIDNEVIYVPYVSLKRHKIRQSFFDELHIPADLKNDIREHGIIDSLVAVYDNEAKIYYVIDGIRRLVCAKEFALHRVPVILFYGDSDSIIDYILGCQSYYCRRNGFFDILRYIRAYDYYMNNTDNTSDVFFSTINVLPGNKLSQRFLRIYNYWKQANDNERILIEKACRNNTVKKAYERLKENMQMTKEVARIYNCFCALRDIGKEYDRIRNDYKKILKGDRSILFNKHKEELRIILLEDVKSILRSKGVTDFHILDELKSFD